MATKQRVWGCCVPDGNNDENYLTCKRCAKLFHYVCLSLNETTLSSDMVAVWTCPDCVYVGPKTAKGDDTPIRNITTRGANKNVKNSEKDGLPTQFVLNRGNKRPALNSPPMDNKSSATKDEIRKIVQEVVKKELEDVMGTFKDSIISAPNLQTQPIRDDIAQIKDAMTFLSAQYDELKKEHEDTKQNMMNLQKENVSLRSNVTELNLRVNELEQQTRSKNIEIQCVPENKNENLVNIITELGKVVGCELKQDDITSCTRVAKINKSSTRPRAIVAQFTTTRTRDLLIASSINFNRSNPQQRLSSSLIGISGSNVPIFVSEHLSPTNKALHAAARQAAKEKLYKYVWVRNGRIYMRKTDESEYILVKNMVTLERLK